MYRIMIGMIALFAMLTGCHANMNPMETSQQVSVKAKPLIGIQTYESLDELVLAFGTATDSNAKRIMDDEIVYYLAENNRFDTSMQEVQEAESYFNCIYDNGTMLITKRYEDGYRALESMTTNNADVFTKKYMDGFEYYYTIEDDVEYYLWIYDGTYLQLNVPIGSNIRLGDIVENLEYMNISLNNKCRAY